MKRIILLIKVLCISMMSFAQSPFEGLSNEQVLEDLQYLKKQLTTLHPEPFLFVTEEEFNLNFETIKSSLHSMSDNEKLVAFLKLTTSLGQGHCNLRPFDSYHRAPISFNMIDGQFRIVVIHEKYAKYLGAIPIAVNEIPFEEVKTKLKGVIPKHETEIFSNGWIAYYLSVREMLNGLGVIQESSNITYKLKLDNGEVHDLTLPTYSREELSEVKRVNAFDERPLYMQRENEFGANGGQGLWVKQLDHLLYFRFSTYTPTKVFKKFRKIIRKAIKEDTSGNLLIDLRRNGGGDFIRVRKHFLPTLEKAVKKSGIKVYVGIGEGTFSAAVSNATDFVKQLNGTLIGEPTSGRPNGYQDNCGFTLPNSKIPGSTACVYRKFIEEDTPGLFPEIEIPLTWEDYKNGRDPLLEYFIDY